MPALATILPLGLRPASGPGAPVHGWLVSGTDAGVWLTELLRVGLPLERARVLALPEGGALVSIPDCPPPKTPPRAVPFTCRAGVLWLPCDAELSPAVTDAEISGLCPWAATVWHPAFPPVVFEPEEILAVSDLFVPPPVQAGAPWTGTVGADPMMAELRAVRLAVVFDEEALFGGEEQRIGSEPVPGLPIPGSRVLSSWGNWIGAALSAFRRKQGPDAGPAGGTAGAGNTAGTARRGIGWRLRIRFTALAVMALLWLCGLPRNNEELAKLLILVFLICLVVFLSSFVTSIAGTPRPPAGRGTKVGPGSGFRPAKAAGGGGLRGWMQRLSEEMERRRWKAVEDLLEEFRRDPDRALRRALPLGGGGALHRGRAAPTDRLGDRIPDFSLGGLNRSGPVDNWDLPPHYQEKLRSQYLALAQAEVRRGRHRAAAYIYAHLLGDLASAAATLKAGGFHREAATLYRTRLNNSAAAAECLSAAGCHVEAGELYEELGNWVSAGDAFALAGLTDRAEIMWRTAIRAHLDRKDVLTAAVLLEQKLEQPEEALTHLTEAWPDHAQAVSAVLAAYDLMARRQLPVPALEFTQRLTGSPPPAGQHESLAKVLTGIARAWPHPAVRETAKEGALSLIAARIAGPDAAACRRAGALLTELEAGDPLLRRDTARQAHLLQEAELASRRRMARPAATSHARGTRELRIIRCGEIVIDPTLAIGPADTACTGLSGEGPDVFVLMHLGGSLILLVSDWESGRLHPTAEWPGWKSGIPPALTRGPHGLLMLNGPAVAAGFGARPPSLQPVSRDGGRPPLSAGQPSWMHGVDRFAAVCGDLWCLAGTDSDNQVEFRFVDPTGQLRDCITPKTDEDEPFRGAVVACAAHGNRVFALVAGGLLNWRPDMADFEELPHPPRQLAASPSWAAPGVLVGCEFGAWHYCPQTGERLALNADQLRPVVGFTGRSHLIAIDDREGIVAKAEKGKFTRFQRFPWPHGRPVSVLPHPDGDRFGVLTADGSVQIYRILEPS